MSKKSPNQFSKTGFKKSKGRPLTVSRSGLPKIYPPNINAHVWVPAKIYT
jgi:hypothetical protein